MRGSIKALLVCGALIAAGLGAPGLGAAAPAAASVAGSTTDGCTATVSNITQETLNGKEVVTLRVIHASRQKCRPITAEMVVANVSMGRR